MIVENYYFDASDTDVLAAPSRLAAIPYDGVLTLEMIAQTATDTNKFECTIQLPNGDVPLDEVMVSAGTGSSPAILDLNTKYVVSFPVSSGGHVLVAMVKTGSSSAQLRATLMP